MGAVDLQFTSWKYYPQTAKRKTQNAKRNIFNSNHHYDCQAVYESLVSLSHWTIKQRIHHHVVTILGILIAAKHYSNTPKFILE